jgi:hypothetical protein
MGGYFTKSFEGWTMFCKTKKENVKKMAFWKQIVNGLLIMWFRYRHFRAHVGVAEGMEI